MAQTTPIQLDKVRNFKFGMRATDTIEKTLNVSVYEMDLDKLTIHQTAVMMWAGLVWEDKDLTPDKVMDLVDEHSNFVDAVNVMGKAFTVAFQGSAAGGAEGNGKKKKK